MYAEKIYRCMMFSAAPSQVYCIKPKGRIYLAKQKNRCVSGNGSENFRYGRHTYVFFWEKNVFLCILKGILPFKMHKIIPEKNLGFTSKFRWGRVTLNTGIFLFGISPYRVKAAKSQYLLDRTIINHT